MMANLFPTFEVPAVITNQNSNSQKVPIYKKGAFFDFKIGDFKRDGANSIATASARDAWIQWCFKNASTERSTCLAYDSDFGVEKDKIAQTANRQMAESDLASSIKEALLADPYRRTKAVDSFVFDWSEGTLEFSITGEEGVETIKVGGITNG